MVKIFSRETSSKICSCRNLIHEAKSKERINVSNFVLCNIFLECRNQTDIAIQKYSQQDAIHTSPAVKGVDIIKLLLLASTRHYSEAILLVYFLC